MDSYWIDNHTHLNMLKERSVSEALEEAAKEGIYKVINIGTDSKDHPLVLDLAKKHKEIYCTLGVHPHDAEDFINAKDFMLENFSHPKVVAVGEIGLDFYYDNAPRDVQKEVFRKQMALAENQNLPVQIHSRDAEEETLAVLREYKGRVKGLLHCFSGSRELAEEAMDLGFHFSLSGVLTFKSAASLRETIKEVIEMDRIHMETDAPFLAPHPFRGKENHPAMMVKTAEVVAELKGVSLDELKRQSYQNSLRLFKKLKN